MTDKITFACPERCGFSTKSEIRFVAHLIDVHAYLHAGGRVDSQGARMTRDEARQAVAKIMKRDRPLSFDAVMRPRSSARMRYAVGWYRFNRSSRWHAYGATWEEALRRLKTAMEAQ